MVFLSGQLFLTTDAHHSQLMKVWCMIAQCRAYRQQTVAKALQLMCLRMKTNASAKHPLNSFLANVTPNNGVLLPKQKTLYVYINRKVYQYFNPKVYQFN